MLQWIPMLDKKLQKKKAQRAIRRFPLVTLRPCWKIFGEIKITPWLLRDGHKQTKFNKQVWFYLIWRQDHTQKDSQCRCWQSSETFSRGCTATTETEDLMKKLKDFKPMCHRHEQFDEVKLWIWKEIHMWGQCWMGQTSLQGAEQAHHFEEECENLWSLFTTHAQGWHTHTKRDVTNVSLSVEPCMNNMFKVNLMRPFLRKKSTHFRMSLCSL